MRKIVTLLLIGFFIAGGLSACGKKNEPVYQKSTEKSKSNG